MRGNSISSKLGAEDPVKGKVDAADYDRTTAWVSPERGKS